MHKAGPGRGRDLVTTVLRAALDKRPQLQGHHHIAPLASPLGP